MLKKSLIIATGITLTLFGIILYIGTLYAQYNPGTGTQYPPKNLGQGSRDFGYFFHEVGTAATYTEYFGTQSVTGSGTAGRITGTSSALPHVKYAYAGGTPTFNFVGGTLQNEGVDVSVSADLNNYIAVSGGTGTGNTLTNATLDGTGTISANIGLTGNITVNSLELTPTELSYLNNASSEIQAQITTATGSITNHTHTGSDGTAQIAHDSVTGTGTNSHTTIDAFITSKAQSSGLASLDANSLVVENPASGTTTSTASSIPISDGSGKIADDWLNSTVTLLGQNIELGTETTGTTDNVSEGSTNLYYQDSRVNAAVGSLTFNTLADVVITSPAENHKISYSGGNWVNATDTAIIDWSGITGNPTDNGSITASAGSGSANKIGVLNSEGYYDSFIYQISLGTQTDGILPGTRTDGIFNYLAAGTNTLANKFVNIAVPYGSSISIVPGYTLVNSTTYSYTGGIQQYVVPQGINSVKLTCKGAGGGNRASGAIGGSGGYAQGYLTVQGGDILYLFVGGKGGDASGETAGAAGYNGGGTGGGSSGGGQSGAGGGGMSDVRLNGTSTSNIKILASGGGGGTVSNAGGSGGGLSGNDGAGAGSGKGGTQANGGAGGTGGGEPGQAGTAFAGGAGGSQGGVSTGGGGGGGYYGGGGGSANPGCGGGGGSSYIGDSAISSGTTTTGGGSAAAVHGSIIIEEGRDIDLLNINNDFVFRADGTFLIGTITPLATSTTDILLQIAGKGYSQAWLVPSFKEAKENIQDLTAIEKRGYLEDVKLTDFKKYNYLDTTHIQGGIITNDEAVYTADWMKDANNPRLKSLSPYIDGLAIALQTLAFDYESAIGSLTAEIGYLKKLIAKPTPNPTSIYYRLDVLEPAP